MNCDKLLVKTILNLFLIILLQPTLMMAQDKQPKKIIYETDMCADVDDVGGLAILHAMANNGEAEILAVCFNEVYHSGAAAIDAINTWYGRGDIPVGIYRGTLNNPDGSAYLDHVAGFPHDLENNDAPSALDVYRQVLAQQPDSSVTIISVGFLNNINDLLLAEPGLVAQKVKELVQMAGLNNDGFNLVRHNLVSASENVIKNWPTPLVISQAGGSILTADNLENAPEENPVREAFFRYFGNRWSRRPSWDEMAVLYGVRGLSSYFRNITSGTGSLPNGYVWSMVPGFRSYLSNRLANSSYVRIIEDLMDQLPLGAHFNISAKSGWLPFSVEFDASTSNVGGDRTIQQYLWDFGDGTNGQGEIVNHEYTITGEHDVQLTVIDDFGDSLLATDSIRVSDPTFSPINYFGNVLHYERNQAELWSTRMDSNDLRYYLSNEPRNSKFPLPGFCFIKDSTYSEFNLSLTTRTGEDLSQNSFADYWIIFGYENENNYNYLLMKRSTSRLVSVTNGQSIDFGRTSTKGIPNEAYHEVSLNLSQGHLTVTLDDSVFLTSISSRLQKIGKIGFGSSKYASFFDDINVIRYGSPTNIVAKESLPSHFKLWQNYPNPFNPVTKIQFSLAKSKNVKIEIFNLIGQKIKTLINKAMPAGSHTVTFNGQNIVSGVYFYKIETGEFREMKKMILLK